MKRLASTSVRSDGKKIDSEKDIELMKKREVMMIEFGVFCFELDKTVIRNMKSASAYAKYLNMRRVDDRKNYKIFFQQLKMLRF